MWFGFARGLLRSPLCYSVAAFHTSNTNRDRFDVQAQKLIHSASNLLDNMEKDVLKYDSPQHSLLSDDQLRAIDIAKKDLGYPFCIAFVGGWNKGKSSIINSLMGNKLCKVGIKPTTTQPTIYMHNDIDIKYLWTKTGESENEYYEDEAKNIKIITTKIDKYKGLSIVDLPGLNSGSNKEHDVFVADFIPRADFVVLVATYDECWSESEEQSINYIRSKSAISDKNIVSVINKCDQTQEMDHLRQIRMHRKENIQKFCHLSDDHKIFLVSAIYSNDDALNNEWDQFVQYIDEKFTEEFTKTAKCEKTINAADEIIKTAKHCIDLEHQILDDDKIALQRGMNEIKKVETMISKSEYRKLMQDILRGQFTNVKNRVRKYIDTDLKSVKMWIKFTLWNQQTICNEVTDTIYKIFKECVRADEIEYLYPQLLSMKHVLLRIIKDITKTLEDRKNIKYSAEYKVFDHKMISLRTQVLDDAIAKLQNINVACDDRSLSAYIEKTADYRMLRIHIGELFGAVCVVLIPFMTSSLLVAIPMVGTAASVMYIAYHVNKFKKDVLQAVDRFCKETIERVDDEITKIIRNMVHHVEEYVTDALTPVFKWNKEQIYQLPGKEQIVNNWEAQKRNIEKHLKQIR
eukprot:192638_1